MSIEVLEDPGPFCMDVILKDVTYEIEESSQGPVLFVTWDNQGAKTTLEVRGEQDAIDLLSRAIEDLCRPPQETS